MKLVISQPMYFPWVGMLEQLQLADIFVIYDDVQYSRGFFNRVQIKTNNGTEWLTIPIKDVHKGMKIFEILIDNSTNWQRKHLSALKHAYSAAPFYREMIDIVENILGDARNSLFDITKNSMLSLIEYFNLKSQNSIYQSSNLSIHGSGSLRLLNICQALNATTYITGHGAKNYLDVDIFYENKIEVQLMDYKRTVYPQLFGDFTPYVSSLDLIANCGKTGREFITSPAKNWREIVK